MIKEFYHSKEDLERINREFQTPNNHRMFLERIQTEYVGGYMLEADQRNALTEKLGTKFGCRVDCAAGDFNWELDTDRDDYGTVFSSHVIEHLANQLAYLVYISEVMSVGGYLHIVFPQRPKWLWVGHHYHEVDHYRFRLIAKEAGFEVISYIRYPLRKKPVDHLKGIRPMLRFFLDKQGYYVLRKGAVKGNNMNQWRNDEKSVYP